MLLLKVTAGNAFPKQEAQTERKSAEGSSEVEHSFAELDKNNRWATFSTELIWYEVGVFYQEQILNWK